MFRIMLMFEKVSSKNEYKHVLARTDSSSRHKLGDSFAFLATPFRDGCVCNMCIPMMSTMMTNERMEVRAHN